MTSFPEDRRTPFFLEREGRRLFAIYHPAAPAAGQRGGAVFFAPFAEELNRTRRMATLLGEALSAIGVATLIFDYSCTGDSTGDFGDASWDGWVDDGVGAIEWMADRTGGPVTLVGLRLGAAIALHSAQRCADRIGQTILWQPVTSGRNMLTQFLRIRVASGMGTGGTQETTRMLRDRFAAGETVEIGGYDIAPDLAAALDTISLAEAPPPAAATWIEIANTPDAEILPPSQKVIGTWQENGLPVAASAVTGEQFWSTVEMTTAPSLIDATLASLTEERP